MWINYILTSYIKSYNLLINISTRDIIFEDLVDWYLLIHIHSNFSFSFLFFIYTIFWFKTYFTRDELVKY